MCAPADLEEDGVGLGDMLEHVPGDELHAAKFACRDGGNHVRQLQDAAPDVRERVGDGPGGAA